MKQPRGLAVFAVVLIAKLVERREGASNAGQPPTPYRGLSGLDNDSWRIHGQIETAATIVTQARVRGKRPPDTPYGIEKGSDGTGAD